MYKLGFGEKNEFLIIVWISSDVFELDANVANFVYYGKIRLVVCFDWVFQENIWGTQVRIQDFAGVGGVSASVVESCWHSKAKSGQQSKLFVAGKLLGF